MKTLIVKVKNIFSKKKNDNIDLMCNGIEVEPNGYCSLEYTYKKKDSL